MNVKYKVNDQVQFHHKFFREFNTTLLIGTIESINGYDLTIKTIYGSFVVGSWRVEYILNN